MSVSTAQVLNLTPHVINVVDDKGHILEAYPPEGVTARVKVEAKEAGEMDGFPAVTNVYGEVEGLPEPKPGRVYLVSLMVLAACTGRSDVFAPDTGPASVVRDESGQIIGVQRFVAAS